MTAASIMWALLITLTAFLSATHAAESELLVDPAEQAEEFNFTSTAEVRFKIFKLNWAEVREPIIIIAWLLLAAYAKLIFNLSPWIACHVPDSALLIVLGFVCGAILSLIGVDYSDFELEPEVFFIFLLPPIVFDAGYFMPNRAFFENLGTILIYAVIGTIFNTVTIGFSMYMCSNWGLYWSAYPFLHIMLFASLISAVDPVAVLCVFEEIHVNEMLYITVFGESLLNDAVTVVLYTIFRDFSVIQKAGSIKAIDIIAGFASFFVISIGGVLIGVAFALITAITTKFSSHVKIINLFFCVSLPLLSYMVAELFGLSAIMAIVFCGITMKQYIKENIGNNARISIRYFIKMYSNMMEALIFLFLGSSMIGRWWHLKTEDYAFTYTCLLFCLVYRAIGVLIQTFFINQRRLKKFNFVDQFIMAYGGLRGAIAYGLALSIPSALIGQQTKTAILNATETVILFTVFIQGTTIKPLVNCLKVEKAVHREKNVHEHLMDRIFDRLNAGVEDICGIKGHHWMRHSWDYYNTKYLKPLFIRQAYNDDMKLIKSFAKIEEKAAMDQYQQSKKSRADEMVVAQQNGVTQRQGVSNEAYEIGDSPTEPRPPREARVSLTLGQDSELGSELLNKAFGDSIKYRRMSRQYVNDDTDDSEKRKEQQKIRLLQSKQSVKMAAKQWKGRARQQTSQSVYDTSSAMRNRTMDDSPSKDSSNADATVDATQRSGGGGILKSVPPSPLHKITEGTPLDDFEMTDDDDQRPSEIRMPDVDLTDLDRPDTLELADVPPGNKKRHNSKL